MATNGESNGATTNGATPYALELPARSPADQVPLSVVIERVIGVAHAELANLAETSALRSLPARPAHSPSLAQSPLEQGRRPEARYRRIRPPNPPPDSQITRPRPVEQGSRQSRPLQRSFIVSYPFCAIAHPFAVQDIINFLHLQSQQHEQTIAKLAQVKLSLASARSVFRYSSR